jgi:hypothetical protein
MSFFLRKHATGQNKLHNYAIDSSMKQKHSHIQPLHHTLDLYVQYHNKSEEHNPQIRRYHEANKYQWFVAPGSNIHEN